MEAHPDSSFDPPSWDPDSRHLGVVVRLFNGALFKDELAGHLRLVQGSQIEPSAIRAIEEACDAETPDQAASVISAAIATAILDAAAAGVSEDDWPALQDLYSALDVDVTTPSTKDQILNAADELVALEDLAATLAADQSPY